MDKNRWENSLFSSLFLYRSRKTDCFPVCYTKLDRKTDGLAMGIFPALFPSKTWPYNGFLEPCFLALRLGNVFFNFDSEFHVQSNKLVYQIDHHQNTLLVD